MPLVVFQVSLSQPCPIIYGVWSVHDLLGNTVMEPQQFFHGRFANDELTLDNMKTFYVEVWTSESTRISVLQMLVILIGILQ
jgi:hypothetical protein